MLRLILSSPDENVSLEVISPSSKQQHESGRT